MASIKITSLDLTAIISTGKLMRGQELYHSDCGLVIMVNAKLLTSNPGIFIIEM
jgi:hypothetical protein